MWYTDMGTDKTLTHIKYFIEGETNSRFHMDLESQSMLETKLLIVVSGALSCKVLVIKLLSMPRG